MRAVMLCAVVVAIAWGQQIRPITLDELLRVPADTTVVRVRNFWATWCKPCVEEMPIFGKVAEERRDVVVEMVSVDVARDSAAVERFWRRRGFKQVRAYHLRQKLGTAEIDRIAPEWSGAIPFTIVERGNRRLVHEGELTEQQLRQMIDSVRVAR